MSLHALILALFVAASLAACGDTDEQDAAAPEASTPAPSPSPEASDATRIRIGLGGTEVTGRLLDNATARDLADQLPLTLEVRDHNSAEKTGPLLRELPLDGAPAGHDPAAGDIGYWAPGGDFVLYYDDAAPYFDGIVRIGEIDGGLDAIRQLPDGASVTVERAE